MNNEVINVEVLVHNLPAQEIAQGAFVVVRVVDGKMWFYGLYDDIDRAESAVVEIGNGIILEKK